MKQRELQKCAHCNRGVMHKGDIWFVHIVARNMVVNLPAVQTQTGLEMMLGNCAFVAQALGPDQDIAVPMSGVSFVLCSECCLKPITMAELMEQVSDASEAGSSTVSG